MNLIVLPTLDGSAEAAVARLDVWQRQWQRQRQRQWQQEKQREQIENDLQYIYDQAEEIVSLVGDAELRLVGDAELRLERIGDAVNAIDLQVDLILGES